MNALRTVLALTTVLLLEGSAGAVKLRRPYAPAVARNYGFDNNGAAAGCRDNACGGTCYDTHRGTDFPIPLGTDVLAGADGEVIATVSACANYGGLGNTCGGGFGNHVAIRHADGDISYYAHMQQGSIVVAVGAKVTCGQRIGRSASSGSSTGPHLHVAIKPGGGAYTDSYSGACTSSKGYWTAQAAVPGDGCECAASAEVCNGRDDDCDGKIDEDDVCELQELLLQPEAYAPTRSSDVDGDGRADVCGRGGSGFWCHLSNGTAFSPKTTPSGFSDASGWGDLVYGSTLRMGDLDGDGRADVCARASSGVVCKLSKGAEGFGPDLAGPTWTDASGWNAPKHFTTFRLADVNGDGKDDVCARSAAGISCALSTGSGFEAPFDGPAWSDAAGFGAPRFFGTLRVGDIDADGKDDLCIRTSTAFECYRSNGAGFDRKVELAGLGDAAGWGAQKHWATIRLGDVNGDRRADVCARSATALLCWFSTGEGFGPAIEVAPLSDANGWDDPANYRTLRIADVDGDGAGELCARSNAAIECYKYDGAAFVKLAGPPLSDASGWGDIAHHGTLMFADATGDRKADLFGRAGAGGLVYPSTGAAFGDAIPVDEFKNDGGWAEAKYWSTLRFGLRCTPKPETCNGRDDDCDGAIDEDDVCSMPGADAGATAPDGAAVTPEAGPDNALDEELQGSCGCRTTSRSDTPSALLLAALLTAWTRRRRRR